MATQSRHAVWGAAGTGFDVDRDEVPSRALTFDPADEFYPGEPIGAPVRRRSRVRTFSSIVMLGMAGWGIMQTSAVWRPWLNTGWTMVSAALERRQAIDQAATAAAITQLATPPPIEPLSMTKDVAEVAGTALNPPGVEPVAQPAKEEETTPTAKDDAVESQSELVVPAPLTAPQIDQSDPYQKRAAAIGLHPQISRALLSSLSDTDYSNAATAIRKALVEASDTDKYVWPRQSNTKHAIFQVHFVSGDRDDCRRYIVTVLKDGWTTTAPPLEKCGIKPPKRNAQTDARPHM